MFYFYLTSALYKVYALCMLFSWHSIILLTLSTAKGQQTPQTLPETKTPAGFYGNLIVATHITYTKVKA